METTSTIDEKVYGYKLVPWLNWDEWDSVRLSIFSSSSNSIASALRRISAWKSRGCLPGVIEVTASIIEIQQKDPYFRKDLRNEDSESEEMLAMLYSMAIMRLVNSVVEKTRKKNEVSIAEAAEAMNIPRMLIDIRHESSHRDLPSLQVLRLASSRAVDWLKTYYWDPQMEAIPFRRANVANTMKEIKFRFRELASCLKAKQSRTSDSSHAKGGRQCEQHCGRTKIFSLMARKIQPSKHTGSKKQITRGLSNLIRLYSFFHSEVVSVLLGFLLKTTSRSNVTKFQELSLANLCLDIQRAAFDEWRPVIVKFSTMEPELLLNLLHAVADLIDSREAVKYDFGGEHLSLSQYDAEVQKIEVLSSIFSWLVDILKELKPVHSEGPGKEVRSCALPKATLIELLRRCLFALKPGNNQLLRSSWILAEMVGSGCQIDKLKKLSSIYSNSDNSLPTSAVEIMLEPNKMDLALHKLKSIKRVKSANASETRRDNTETTCRWTVAESWNPCPLGMLPRLVGSSGYLPVLDQQNGSPSPAKRQEDTFNPAAREENLEPRKCSGKREASCDHDVEHSSPKRLKETTNACELDDMEIIAPDGPSPDDMETTSPDGPEGQLLIGGVWRKVRGDELLEIQSAIRLLV